MSNEDWYRRIWIGIVPAGILCALLWFVIHYIFLTSNRNATKVDKIEWNL